jgi:histidine triad (HIT) family protein
MENDCIFCRIVRGEIPAKIVYEDELVLCFLDVNPKTKGHLLIIPKEHYENIFDTPDDSLERINVVAKKMGLLLKERLGAKGVNVINASGKDAQQSVFHLHYHVVPRFLDDGMDLWFHGESKFLEDVDKVYELLK